MESCKAGSGRPVSSPAASLTKTEFSQRVPTEDLIHVRKTLYAPFVFHYCRAGGTSDIDYHNPDIDWDPNLVGSWFLHLSVCLDGQGYQHPEVPDLKVFEGLLPVPHGSQNDSQKCCIPNICLTLEMENEGFVGGGFPDH